MSRCWSGHKHVCVSAGTPDTEAGRLSRATVTFVFTSDEVCRFWKMVEKCQEPCRPGQVREDMRRDVLLHGSEGLGSGQQSLKRCCFNITEHSYRIYFIISIATENIEGSDLFSALRTSNFPKYPGGPGQSVTVCGLVS